MRNVVDPRQPRLFRSVAEPLEVYKRRAMTCHRCELHKTRTNVVFGEGNNRTPLTDDQRVALTVSRHEKYAEADPRPPLAFVGEGPGAQEDLQGRPFVGPSGRLLDKMIEAMGYARADVYLCNVVCCRPPGNRTPEKEEQAACAPFLAGQLKAVRPRIVVALGSTAARALTGTTAPVGQLRGRWWEWEDTPVRVSYHPAALLRDASLKKAAWEDLKQVIQALEQRGLRR